eukprot:Clim_evm17s209 gene=Clim_evmTU17s209
MAASSVGRMFGPHKIPLDHIFHNGKNVFCFVNIKPVVPGHALVATNRVVERVKDLEGNEAMDLMLAAQQVSKLLEAAYDATGTTIAIQDGPIAGQTVPHVHIHVLPRKEGDFKRNDEVYEELDRHDKDTRQNRSFADMAKEATDLRKLWEQLGNCPEST